MEIKGKGVIIKYMPVQAAEQRKLESYLEKYSEKRNDVMRQKHILVGEDNELNREMLVDILSDQYVIHEAENGQAALDFLNHSREEIALILLDMMMPVMDGYTFLK